MEHNHNHPTMKNANGKLRSLTHRYTRELHPEEWVCVCVWGEALELDDEGEGQWVCNVYNSPAANLWYQ